MKRVDTAEGRGHGALLLALARGLSHVEAAREARVSRSTVERRLADPVFRAEVEKVRADMIGRAVGKLADAAAEAVEALRTLLTHDSPWVREAAARDILGAVVRVREHADLAERVAELESRAHEIENNGRESCSAIE